MRRLYWLQLVAGFAFLTVGAVLAPAALALPELLGWEGNKIFKTEKAPRPLTIETVKGEAISCTALSVDGLQSADTNGEVHFHLSGCKALGFDCNTEGDEAEIILILGLFNYVFNALGAGLGVATLFQLSEFTIKCTALVTFRVKGSFMCSEPEPLVSSEIVRFVCAQTKGVPAEKTYWDDAGNEQHTQLLVKKNAGAFVEAGVSVESFFTFAGASVAFMNE